MSLRIGILGPDVPGHLNPLTTLGNELDNRGHAVTLIGSAAAEPYAVRENLEFESMGTESGLGAQLDREFIRLGECSQFGSMLQTGKCFGLHSKMILSDLPDVLDRKPLDALVVDQFTPAGWVVAEQIGLPLVIACNALAAHWDAALPPPPLNWAYRDDFIGRWRNRIARTLMPKLYFWLAESRVTGVDPMKLVFEPNHGLAQISQQPAFFDFPRQSLPERFSYTAPWHRVDRDDKETEFPWDQLDGRPLIYALMGTLQNRLAHVFQAIFEVAGEFDHQVVVSKGGGSLSWSAPLPENVIVVDRAAPVKIAPNRLPGHHPCRAEHGTGMPGLWRSDVVSAGDE